MNTEEHTVSGQYISTTQESFPEGYPKIAGDLQAGEESVSVCLKVCVLHPDEGQTAAGNQ